MKIELSELKGIDRLGINTDSMLFSNDGQLMLLIVKTKTDDRNFMLFDNTYNRNTEKWEWVLRPRSFSSKNEFNKNSSVTLSGNGEYIVILSVLNKIGFISKLITYKTRNFEYDIQILGENKPKEKGAIKYKNSSILISANSDRLIMGLPMNNLINLLEHHTTGSIFNDNMKSTWIIKDTMKGNELSKYYACHISASNNLDVLTVCSSEDNGVVFIYQRNKEGDYILDKKIDASNNGLTSLGLVSRVSKDGTFISYAYYNRPNRYETSVEHSIYKKIDNEWILLKHFTEGGYYRCKLYHELDIQISEDNTKVLLCNSSDRYICDAYVVDITDNKKPIMKNIYLDSDIEDVLMLEDLIKFRFRFKYQNNKLVGLLTGRLLNNDKRNKIFTINDE